MTEKTDWRTVWFGVSLGALAALQQFKLPPAMPLMLSLYGYGKTLAGSFMSVYAVAGLLVSIPVGKKLGKSGPMGLLALAFTCLMTGNSLSLAWPQSGGVMLLARALEGLGFTVLAVVGAVITTMSASIEHRPVAVAMWASWIPAGQIIATVIAIPAVAAGRWEPIWIAALVITAGVWAWGLGLKAAGSETLKKPETQSASQSAENSDRLKGEGYLLFIASALFGLWSGQYITYVTWLPQYMVEALKVPAPTAAKAYLIPCVMVIPFTLLGARLMKAGVTINALIVSSTLIQAATWYLIPVTVSPALGVLSLAVYGATSGITATAIFSIPGYLLGPRASKGFAAMMAGRNLGVLVGPVLLAQAVTIWGGWTPAPVIFGTACLACAALSIHLRMKASN